MPVAVGETDVVPRAKWSKEIIEDLRELDKLCKDAGLDKGLMLNLPPPMKLGG